MPLEGKSPAHIARAARRLSKPFCITNGKKFRLRDHDPGDTLDFGTDDKERSKEALAAGVRALADLQDKLYAQDQWAVLLVFQAMDAAGKDGVIKHVMSGINPQGCEVHSFKAPTSEELDHDFLWRCSRRVPERGRIGIFNRSYYEEVLVVRVHPEILHKQKVPPALLKKKIWDQRHRDIRAFERYLGRNGILVRKFFLNVSKNEQKKRFLERIETPEKNWKFSSADVRERAHWDDYQRVYEDMIRATATEEAPWYVVPADHKWFSRLVVAAAVIETLASLDLAYPVIGAAQKKELAAAKKELLAEK
ncbi:MAG: polyphosphate kinase 2 family protein [Chthoniobacterales bacterium]|nr:polyphosphate kinase 2 family protein [Chthoniobacterales bacterium]